MPRSTAPPLSATPAPLLKKQQPTEVQRKLLKKKMCLFQLVPCYPLGIFILNI